MERACDTPARWLVHYIAECIEKAEVAQGEEKDKAQEKCANAILKLWHHRSDLPRGIKPFTEFDSVFRGLARLDKNSERAYYNEYSQFDNKTDEDEEDESKEWVDTAICIDKAAKILVSDSFELAASAALTEEAKTILSHAIDDPSDDIKIMLDFMYDENQEDLTEKKIEQLKAKIGTIDALKQICDVFIIKLSEDISNLEEEVKEK